MNLLDLHCDTAYEMFQKQEELLTNNLMVSLDKVSGYDQKAQVFAIWSENTKSEVDVYGDFFKIYENLRNNIIKNSEKAMFCHDSLTLTTKDPRLKIIPAVEGARLLGGDLSRLAILHETGVRILTLTWEDECAVGGAYNTDKGLTPFGFEVLAECERLGIIVDVSHLSEKGFYDVANKAKKPFIASHSNCAAIHPHPRNLTDIQFRTLIQSGGIVGISLVGKHLSAKLDNNPNATEKDVLEQVCNHIEHYLSLGGEKHLSLGMDCDGTDPLPGLENISFAWKIADELQKRGIKEKIISDIFYNNAFTFLCNMI